MASAKPADADIERKFWKAVRSNRIVMLGLAGCDQTHSQPMTILIDDEDEDDKGRHRGPVWFFTSRDTDLARDAGARHAAMIQFMDKGHDLFACIEGELIADNDPATIDRLWNPFVASWFDRGKDDPELHLLRFEPDNAQIWLNEQPLLFGIRLLLGQNPREEYAGKMADLRL